MSWICPKCERELKNPNQWHNCVSVTVDSLFIGKEPNLVLLFDRLLAEVSDWDDVIVSTTQNCIVFVHNKTFLIIKPMKKVIDLKFYSADKLEGPLILKSILYSGKYENHIRIFSLEDLTSVIYKNVKASYNLL